MCKRSKPDRLAKIFLRRYRMNLLSLPGNRVRCGSVYIKQGKSLTAPGDLADIVEPALALPNPYVEEDLPDLRGTWSETVKTGVSLKLLADFLAALGAPALIDKLQAGVQRGDIHSFSFRFADAVRESISPTNLANTLEKHRFRAGNAWVKDGNRYYVAAAVVRSPSITIRAHDEQDRALDLGAGVAGVGSGNVTVSRDSDDQNALVYRGKEPIGFAVELYELHTDKSGELAFKTSDGVLKIVGFDDNERPESAFLGDDDEMIAEVHQ
jgi:hypothetical protein